MRQSSDVVSSRPLFARSCAASRKHHHPSVSFLLLLHTSRTLYLSNALSSCSQLLSFTWIDVELTCLSALYISRGRRRRHRGESIVAFISIQEPLHFSSLLLAPAWCVSTLRSLSYAVSDQRAAVRDNYYRLRFADCFLSLFREIHNSSSSKEQNGSGGSALLCSLP